MHGQINLDRRPWRISPAAIAHGSALLGLYFAVKAWSYWLDRFLLLYNDNGVVVGAGYSDVHVGLPALWILIFVAVVAAVLAWTNVRLHTYRIPIAAVIVAFASSFVFGELVPGLYERFVCETERAAVGNVLHQAEHRPDQRGVQSSANHGKAISRRAGAQFPVAATQYGDHPQHSAVGLAAADGHLRTIAGDSHLLQVPRCRHRSLPSRRLLSSGDPCARELAPSLLSANAQTWVNLHLLFTHGNGVVMSPVTQKSTEGLPIFYLKDIPPVASGGPPITEPRIYFGEGVDEYVIVKGSTPEFDYPKGKENVYTTYDGTDGIAIGGTGGARYSPGSSTTSTSCSAATSPATSRICSIATSRIA